MYCKEMNKKVGKLAFLILGMNGYVSMSYPISSAMAAPCVPVVVPVVSGHLQQKQPQAAHPARQEDLAFEQQLKEQELKLVQRQKELAKVTEKLDSLRREQSKSQQKQEEYEQEKHFTESNHVFDHCLLKGKLNPPPEFQDQNSLTLSPVLHTTNSSSSVKTEHISSSRLRTKPDGGPATDVVPVIPKSVQANKREHHSPITTSFAVVMNEKVGRTELYRKCTGPYLTYENVSWKMFLRKEVKGTVLNTVDTYVKTRVST